MINNFSQKVAKQKLQKYYEFDTTLQAPLDSLNINQIIGKRSVFASRGEIDKMLEMAEYAYFSRNHKRYSNTLFSTDVSLSYYANEPKVLELQKRIKEDIHKMRAEVIAYLKTEGEWDESWDANLK